MRPLVLALAALITLSTASMVRAGPSCVDRNGDPIHCGVKGAMPVGWTPSPQTLLRVQMSRPRGTGFLNLERAACLLALFLAATALLPDFDGAHGEDWDRQEDDGDRRE
jgi:hypothetical protein